MTFGDRVKKYREEKNMSQAELAKRCGYTSRSTISKIESEDRDAPRSTIAKIAKALNVSPVDLIMDRNENNNMIELKKLSETALDIAIAYDKATKKEKELVRMVLKEYLP